MLSSWWRMKGATGVGDRIGIMGEDSIWGGVRAVSLGDLSPKSTALILISSRGTSGIWGPMGSSSPISQFTGWGDSNSESIGEIGRVLLSRPLILGESSKEGKGVGCRRSGWPGLGGGKGGRFDPLTLKSSFKGSDSTFGRDALNPTSWLAGFRSKYSYEQALVGRGFLFWGISTKWRCLGHGNPKTSILDTVPGSRHTCSSNMTSRWLARSK